MSSVFQYWIYTYFTLQLFKIYFSATYSKKTPVLFQNLFSSFSFLFYSTFQEENMGFGKQILK